MCRSVYRISRQARTREWPTATRQCTALASIQRRATKRQPLIINCAKMNYFLFVLKYERETGRVCHDRGPYAFGCVNHYTLFVFFVPQQILTNFNPLNFNLKKKLNTFKNITYKEPTIRLYQSVRYCTSWYKLCTERGFQTILSN